MLHKKGLQKKNRNCFFPTHGKYETVSLQGRGTGDWEVGGGEEEKDWEYTSLQTPITQGDLSEADHMFYPTTLFFLASLQALHALLFW